MRIYGKHSGRNNPTKFIARSYMWNSKKSNNDSGMCLFWFILAIIILIIVW